MAIGQTKTLAKLANYVEKRWQRQTGGVVDLLNVERQRKYMAVLPVDRRTGYPAAVGDETRNAFTSLHDKFLGSINC